VYSHNVAYGVFTVILMCMSTTVVSRIFNTMFNIQTKLMQRKWVSGWFSVFYLSSGENPQVSFLENPYCSL